MDYSPAQKFKVIVSETNQFLGFVMAHEVGSQLVIAVYGQIYREIQQDKDNRYHTQNPAWTYRPLDLQCVLVNPRILIPQGPALVSDDIPYIVDVSNNIGDWQKYIAVTHQKQNLSYLRKLL